MEKRVILAIGMLFLLVPIALAQQKSYLKLRESVLINGKNITLAGLLSREVSEEANFLVDGIFGTVEKSREGEVNGVLINVTGISKSPPVIIVTFRVPFVCGDGACSSLEDYQICCKDCGCGLGARQSCINNICRSNVSHYSSTYDCYYNADCQDGDPCTADICNVQAVPYKCTHAQITSCTSSDGCCPRTCSDEEDQDCKTVNRCMSKGECNDNNPCTKDFCEGTPRRCKYTTETGCPLSNECLPTGTVNAGKYCSAESVWTTLKGVNKPCEQDHECAGGRCQYNKCGGLAFLTGVTASNIYTIILYIALIATALAVVTYVIISKKKPRLPQPGPG